MADARQSADDEGLNAVATTTLSESWEATRLIGILRERLPELQERYGVDYLGVFGSYVRNEQRPDSDLDVLVGFDEKPGLLRYIELQNLLTDLLKMRVDPTNMHTLKPGVAENILREVVSI